MKCTIADNVFNQYPETIIGYIIANITVTASDPKVELMKNNLHANLLDMGITRENYLAHPNIQGWKKIFMDFDVNKNYCSSVESLVKRIIKGNKMCGISNIVDLYNSCSLLSLIPMGGYDLENIAGDIILRYGNENDSFEPLGSTETIQITKQQIVYADEEKVLCWLWNYRDSKLSAINKDTKKAIFFLDSAFEPQHMPIHAAIDMLKNHLEQMGSNILTYGVLNRGQPSVMLSQ